MNANRKTELYIEIGRLVRTVASCTNKQCEACKNALALKDKYNAELNELRTSV